MDLEKYIYQFDPKRDSSGWNSEEPYEYAERIKTNFLPHWPEEVLIEWLHRHSPYIDDYAFLGFENFRFDKQKWPLDQIPGREVFADPNFLDSFVDVEKRALNWHDWLAKYMLANGTWPTPIILLQNENNIIAPSRLSLNVPLHLLEGHKRLSYLNGLRRIGRAQEEHFVWVVHLTDGTNPLHQDS